MTRNTAASVRARLTNRAKSSQRTFQETLQHYALERLLYRLAQSPYQSRFVLKGALLLNAWGAPVSRPTRDIDLLGYMENDVGVLENTLREICDVAVVDDGLRFDTANLSGQRIKADAEYPGVRLTFTAFLERAQIPIQLDIGFGDVVHPRVEERDYPTLLNFPAPTLRMYPRETVVAEKFEAMIHLGTVNTRMKDFFDIWLLARQFDFIGADLAEAIQKTFENRGTTLETEPVALTSTFSTAESTQRQWAAFVKRSQLNLAPKSLEEVREPLRQFLLPVVRAVIAGQNFTERWPAPGPWQRDPAGLTSTT